MVEAVEVATDVREPLVSVFVRGHVHAAFPTARRTLCLVPCMAEGEEILEAPDCRLCRRVAAGSAFRRATPLRWGFRTS